MNFFKRIIQKIFGILPLVGYILILAYIFWPTLNPPKGQMIFGDDIYDHQYFLRSFFRDTLRSGEIPWWNPYTFSGFPFASHPATVNLFYPLTYIFVILPVPIAMAWYLYIHVLIGACGMYWLMRRWTGKTAAFFAGFAYACSGYIMPKVYAGHVDIIASTVYLPIIVGCFWNMWNTQGKLIKRELIKTAFFISLQTLSGFQMLVVFTLEAAGICALVYSIYKKSFFPLVTLFAAVVLSVGFSAVQLFPNIQLMNATYRASDMPYAWAVKGALTIDNIPQLFNGLYRDFRLTDNPRPLYPDHVLFAGATTIVLAVAAVILLFLTIIRKRKDLSQHQQLPLAVSALIIGIFGVWVSYGDNALFDLHNVLWKFVPIYHYMRIPPRHVILFIFSASVLSSVALNAIRKNWIRVAALIILTIELIPLAKHFIALNWLPQQYNDTQVVTQFTTDAGLWRYLPNYIFSVRLGNTLDFNAPLTYKFFSASGYDAVFLKNYYNFFTAAFIDRDKKNALIGIGQMPVITSTLSGPEIDFLNVKYILGQGDMTPEDPQAPGKFKLLIDNTSRWYKLVQNTSYLPRFFMAPSVAFYPNTEVVWDVIHSGEYNIGKTIVLVDPKKNPGQRYSSACLAGQIAPVTVKSYTLSTIVLETNTPCDAYLASSEVMYPGWTARIDGKRVPILEGNLAFRTVFVPGGKHEVIMQYIPMIFVFGGCISLLSIILTFMVWKR